MSAEEFLGLPRVTDRICPVCDGVVPQDREECGCSDLPNHNVAPRAVDEHLGPNPWFAIHIAERVGDLLEKHLTDTEVRAVRRCFGLDGACDTDYRYDLAENGQLVNSALKKLHRLGLDAFDFG